ncbi:MAG: hypothetical protein H7Y10_10670 [Flavobacterium sp.]|nr:hypothetical protein [Flavobacterium sp.]
MKTEISDKLDTSFYAKDKLHLEKILKAFYDTTNSVRFFALADSSVLFFNRKAEEELFSLIGKKIKTGVSIKKLFKKSDILESFIVNFERALKGEHTSIEHLIGPCDQRIWFKIEHYPVVYDMKILGVSISIRNINKRKQKDQLLLHKNRLLKDILYTHSHDIRSPLTNILGLIALFNRLELTGENLEIFNLLEVAVNNLDDAIKGIVTEAYKEPIQ